MGYDVVHAVLSTCRRSWAGPCASTSSVRCASPWLPWRDSCYPDFFGYCAFWGSSVGILPILSCLLDVLFVLAIPRANCVRLRARFCVWFWPLRCIVILFAEVSFTIDETSQRTCKWHSGLNGSFASRVPFNPLLEFPLIFPSSNGNKIICRSYSQFFEPCFDYLSVWYIFLIQK